MAFQDHQHTGGEGWGGAHPQKANRHLCSAYVTGKAEASGRNALQRSSPALPSCVTGRGCDRSLTKNKKKTNAWLSHGRFLEAVGVNH